MGHTKWSNPIPEGQAMGIFTALEGDPANPKHDEVHVRDGQVLPPQQHRITPHVAFVESEGAVRLGILDDGWSESRAAQADASVTFTTVAHPSSLSIRMGP